MILTKGGFDIIRAQFGKLTVSQVQGFNFIVEQLDKAGWTYPQVAYALATVWHETAGTMQPIVERGAVSYFDKYDTGKLAKALGNTPEKDGDGYKWRGRGYVQITGANNYSKLGSILRIPLTQDPDLALKPEVAIKILTVGMWDGLFTGKGYRNVQMRKYNLNDYKYARRIINGTDKATKIANEAMVFERALRSL